MLNLTREAILTFLREQVTQYTVWLIYYSKCPCASVDVCANQSLSDEVIDIVENGNRKIRFTFVSLVNMIKYILV